eukprot:Gb_10837 [translate_table: standard]
MQRQQFEELHFAPKIAKLLECKPARVHLIYLDRELVQDSLVLWQCEVNGEHPIYASVNAVDHNIKPIDEKHQPGILISKNTQITKLLECRPTRVRLIYFDREFVQDSLVLWQCEVNGEHPIYASVNVVGQNIKPIDEKHQPVILISKNTQTYSILGSLMMLTAPLTGLRNDSSMEERKEGRLNTTAIVMERCSESSNSGKDAMTSEATSLANGSIEEMKKMFATAESAMEAWAMLAIALGRASFIKSEFAKICFLDNHRNDTHASSLNLISLALAHIPSRTCKSSNLAGCSTTEATWKDLRTDLMLVPTGAMTWVCKLREDVPFCLTSQYLGGPYAIPLEVVKFLKRPEKFTAIGARIPKGVLLVGPPRIWEDIRGAGIGGLNNERAQTLNQLLTDMDGFEGNTGVIVIASTNRVDVLDATLLRLGRFDVKVKVALNLCVCYALRPIDISNLISTLCKGSLFISQKAILKVHAGNKKLNKDVSLDVVAMRTPGFSGVDLANLLNKDAILAGGRRGKQFISRKEIYDAIDKIVGAMEGTTMTDGKIKSLVAYHEVGHAIWSRSGRDVEEIIFGEPKVTSGAAVVDPVVQSSDVVLQMIARNSMSEKLVEDIDKDVKAISNKAYEIAKNHIRNNRATMDKIVEILLERETLSRDEF